MARPTEPHVYKMRSRDGKAPHRHDDRPPRKLLLLRSRDRTDNNHLLLLNIVSVNLAQPTLGADATKEHKPSENKGKTRHKEAKGGMLPMNLMSTEQRDSADDGRKSHHTPLEEAVGDETQSDQGQKSDHEGQNSAVDGAQRRCSHSNAVHMICGEAHVFLLDLRKKMGRQTLLHFSAQPRKNPSGNLVTDLLMLSQMDQNLSASLKYRIVHVRQHIASTAHPPPGSAVEVKVRVWSESAVSHGGNYIPDGF